MEKINHEKLILTIVYSLGLAFSLISFIWNVNILIKTNVFLSIVALYFLKGYFNKKHLSIYIYSYLLLFLFIFFSLLVGRLNWRLIAPLHFIIYSYGFAMILINKRVYYWGGYIIFYTLALYFFILMLLGVSGEFALKWSSSNGISTVMLISCISLYIIRRFDKQEIDLKPALITLIISIWGIGRGGILSSFVLFLGLLFIKYNTKKIYIYFILAISCSFFGIIYIYSDWFFDFALNNSFFSNAMIRFIERGGEFSESSARSSMWENYFNNLDVFRIIFGVNVETDPWEDGIQNEFNYHNSFINLHLQTGIIGILTIIILMFSLFNLFSNDKVLFLLLFVLILRSFTDTVIFFGRYDFIVFYFIFIELKRKKYLNF
jgi:hypothetical protein